jgi:hypothetical protein
LYGYPIKVFSKNALEPFVATVADFSARLLKAARGAQVQISGSAKLTLEHDRSNRNAPPQPGLYVVANRVEVAA